MVCAPPEGALAKSNLKDLRATACHGGGPSNLINIIVYTRFPLIPSYPTPLSVDPWAYPLGPAIRSTRRTVYLAKATFSISI